MNFRFFLSEKKSEDRINCATSVETILKVLKAMSIFHSHKNFSSIYAIVFVLGDKKQSVAGASNF